MRSFKTTLTGILAAVSIATSLPALAEVDKKDIQVVGTWSSLSQWKNFENEFWSKTLPEASGGRLTPNAKPMDELGLSGFELMRQIKLGVFDVVHTLVAYSSSDVPMASGIDLAGLVRDRDSYTKMVEAFRPALSAEFERAYGVKILALYSFSGYTMFCNLPEGTSAASGLDALKGRKVRSHSTSMGDFIEGLGGTAVTLPFGEVVPSMQQGVVDCGVTGVLSAYEAKWWQVTNSYFDIPLGYGTVVVAVNLDFWNSLSEETQELIEKNVAQLEDKIMAGSAQEDELGFACYGAGPCSVGEAAKNVKIELSDADRAKIDEVVANIVLKRFAERCGDECASDWSDSVGAALGVKAAK